MNKSLRLPLRSIVGMTMLLLASLSAAQDRHGQVLGQNGYTYELVGGPLTEILGVGIPGVAPFVLALSITNPEGRGQVLIVPGTDDLLEERSPKLVYFAATDTIFLLWESVRSGIHSQLFLTAFRHQTGWSETLVLSGNPFAVKREPQLVVTRDLVDKLTGAGKLERTVIHLVWREESSRILYSPILMFENAFELVSNQLVRLDSLFEGDFFESDSTALFQVQTGRDERSLLVGFTRPADKAVEAIEIRVLPGQIDELADSVYGRLLESAELDLDSLASHARAHIIMIGRKLNPDLVGIVARDTAAHILGPGAAVLAEGGINALADDARAHIVMIGAKLDDVGLRNASPQTRTRFTRLTTTGAQGEERSHYLELRQVNRVAQPLFDEPPSRLFFSADGKRIAMAWHSEDSITFIEYNGVSWSEPHTVRRTPDRTLEDIYQLLQRRLREP